MAVSKHAGIRPLPASSASTQLSIFQLAGVAMPFRTIACHVWAIDGYVDDAAANTVNTLYTSLGNTLLASHSREDTITWRRSALKTLIDQCRQSSLTDEEATVYGGFRDGQGAPEHMWLEYNGMIYETMPGHLLVTCPATPATRKQTPLEGFAFPTKGVVSVATQLTLRQRACINNPPQA
jgi:hypothetical protein